MTPGFDPCPTNGDFDELHDRLAGVAAAAAADDGPPDPEPGPPPKQPRAGRTPDGKFAKGNPGGCGNPFARQVASFREALYEAVTRDMLKDLACRLWGMAMGGNVAAARLLLQYLIGKPQDPPNPDRVDRDEWQAYQSDAVPGAEFNQLMASMPVPMAVHMAQGVWPIVAEYMIRRPMADMFQEPAQQEPPAKPRKAKKDEQSPQHQPSSNGDNGADPAAAAETARAQDCGPAGRASREPAEAVPASEVSRPCGADDRQQSASDGAAGPNPAGAEPEPCKGSVGTRGRRPVQAPSPDGGRGETAHRPPTRDSLPGGQPAPGEPARPATAAGPPSPTATTAARPGSPSAARPREGGG